MTSCKGSWQPLAAKCGVGWHIPGLSRICYPERPVMSMTLGDLKQKDVINTLTGASLGKPMDIEFCAADGRVSALVVPGEFSLSALFRGERCGIVIPWDNICKIGDDVILVEIVECINPR